MRLAHCHLGLGTLHWSPGKSSESDEHFAVAIAMYREIGMTSWLETAEAEISGLT